MMRIKMRVQSTSPVVRTTLDLPDPLFVRLKARAALERTTIKKLLQAFVEAGLEDQKPSGRPARRRADDLPRIDGDLLLRHDQLSNADLFDVLDA